MVLNGIIENEGKIYLVTSPKISEQDYDAILTGNEAKKDEIIYNSIKKELESFSIEDKESILNYLSWLIAEDILEIKFAIVKNKIGMYHDKIAIFEDGENRVCVHGSINDSITATYNGESVSVFCSWGTGNEYCDIHKKRFVDIWDNKDEFYEILRMPKRLKTEFVNISKKFCKTIPKVRKPREYQKDAIQSWKNNNWNGIFEMATGTGKTITSIFAMKEYLKEKNRQFLVVIVPFSHLVDQWISNLEDFGYSNILECRKSKDSWNDKLISLIKDYNSRLIDKTCIIVTYKTASTQNFYDKIEKVKEHLCLIADECHYLGSDEYSKIMLPNFSARLGLSATPDRWFDDEGTQNIMKYFDGIVYEYSLKKAIDNGFLTPYLYYPQVIELTESEQEEYKSLTRRIVNLLDKKDSNEEYFQALCRKRKNILDKAYNKYEKLIELLKFQKDNNELEHTLIYCSKGDSKNIVNLLKCLNVNVHEFVYDVSEEDRQKILEKFDDGIYQILVAIRCLDEGVDVPSTRVAYFLSSTSNPREFVQRRGRILRKYIGKEKAIIYDFMVFPNDLVDDYSTGQSIIKKELPRFAEFSLNSLNCFEARNEIFDLVSHYNLENRINMTAYEVYKEYEREESSLDEEY